MRGADGSHREANFKNIFSLFTSVHIESEFAFIKIIVGVIVVICNFYRWVMCYPVRNLGAEDCAWELLQHFGIFGITKEILSDTSVKAKTDK